MARKGVAPKGKSRSAGTAPTRHRQLVFGDSRRALVFQPSAQRKPAMRTAADFNLYYAAPDPWHISHARFRDKVLRRCLKPFIRDKSVLELGCGEGHLTHAIFSKARSVVGIDISDVLRTPYRFFDFASQFILAHLMKPYCQFRCLFCIH